MNYLKLFFAVGIIQSVLPTARMTLVTMHFLKKSHSATIKPEHALILTPIQSESRVLARDLIMCSVNNVHSPTITAKIPGANGSLTIRYIVSNTSTNTAHNAIVIIGWIDHATKILPFFCSTPLTKKNKTSPLHLEKYQSKKKAIGEPQILHPLISLPQNIHQAYIVSAQLCEYIQRLSYSILLSQWWWILLLGLFALFFAISAFLSIRHRTIKLWHGPSWYVVSVSWCCLLIVIPYLKNYPLIALSLLSSGAILLIGYGYAQEITSWRWRLFQCGVDIMGIWSIILAIRTSLAYFLSLTTF